MSRTTRLLLAATLALATPATPVQSQEMPPPPKLARDADPHDWEAYFEYGVTQLRRSASKADAAFYWANRMDPTRAEPIYGRWVAFWMLDISEWPDYLEGNKRVLADPKVIASDSVRYRAYARNPFVNQALLLLLFEQLRGGLSGGGVTHGWISYANRNYSEALRSFYAVMQDDPDRVWVRYDLALVFAQMQRYDSAAVQLLQLLDELRAIDRKEVVRLYDSKEMLEYALGLLYAAQGKLGDARQAQERALQENLGFTPAHVALGRLAVARRDTGTAVTEFGLAVELEPKDGAGHFWYGQALVRALRPAEGVEHLATAVRLEPYFADPYLSLATAYEALHDTTRAVAAYGNYLKRAPHSATVNITIATDRVAKLGGTAATP